MEGVGGAEGKEVGEGDADGDVDANCGLLRPVDGRQIVVASLRRFVFYDISSLAAPTNAAQCGRAGGEGRRGEEEGRALGREIISFC